MGAFFSFKTFIFPKITVLIYWLGLIAIVLFMIFGVIASVMAGDNPQLARTGFNGGLGVILSIVGGLIGIVVWRVIVELWLVLFSIHSALIEIRDQNRGASL